MRLLFAGLLATIILCGQGAVGPPGLIGITIQGSGGGGSGTVTHTGGNLTLDGVVLGAGGADVKIGAILTGSNTDCYLGDGTFGACTTGGAPNNAQYLTLAANATLTVERVLATDTSLTCTDAGAGSTYTCAANNAVVAFLGGAQSFTAGAKKSFTPSATTASVRFVPTANPNSPATGDLNIDATYNLNWQDNSTWRSALYGTTACASGQLIRAGASYATDCIGTTTGAYAYFDGSAYIDRIPLVSDLTAFTSASLATALTDELGSGKVIFSAGTLAVASGKTLTASNSITITGTDSSSVAVGAGGTAVKIIASGAKAVDFASTATGACATVITDTATGTASTDTIIFNANASIKAVTGYVPASTGGFSISAYPTANTVNFEGCNWTAGTVDPSSITINWLVVRSM